MQLAQFSDRQLEIIQESLQLIAERGIEHLTYRNLAKRLGISEPAFYRHFASKTEIMVGILVYFDGIRRDLYRDIRAGATGSVQAIEAIFVRHFELFEKNPGLAMLVFPDLIRQDRRELDGKVMETMKVGQDNITSIIQEGIQSGEIRGDLDADQLALMISGALRLLVTRWRIGNYASDLQQQGREFWETLSLLVRQDGAQQGGAT